MTLLSFLLRVGTGSLLCLMPLALYLLFLASLNHRRRPTWMSGRWDFTALLLGLSGFLLLGGPLMVTLIDSTWRGMLFGGNFDRHRSAWDANSRIWSVTAVGYLLALIGFVVYVMNRRESVAVVYNIDLPSINGLIARAAGKLGLTAREVPGGWEFSRSLSSGGLDLDLVQLRGQRTAGRLSVDAFDAFRNVTMRWSNCDPKVRLAIDDEIRGMCDQAESVENAAAGWLMTAAVTTFVVMLFWMGFLVYTLLFKQKGF